MGHAFWWVCVVVAPIWFVQLRLLPRKSAQLFFVCAGYAALITTAAWHFWLYELFGNLLLTWVITFVGVTTFIFVYGKFPDMKDG